MIKNVVFDFGQVMVKFDPLYIAGKHTENSEDAALLASVLFDRLYWDRLDKGTISDDEVINESKKRLPERLHSACEKAYYNWIYNIPEIAEKLVDYYNNYALNWKMNEVKINTEFIKLDSFLSSPM